MSPGIKSSVIQAPSVNLAINTTITVTPVAAAPNPFTNMLLDEPGPRTRFQCITMPAWESVKAMNAPTA